MGAVVKMPTDAGRIGKITNGTEADLMQDRVMNSSSVSSETFNRRSDQGKNSPTIRSQSHLSNPRTRRGTLFHVVFLLGAILSFGCFWAVRSIDAVEGNRNDNVLLDFTASWCGPCQQMSPIVSKLQRERFPIRKVDVDAEPNLSRQYNVGSIPCFVLVVNGREVSRITGATDERKLRSMLMMLPKNNPEENQQASRDSRGSGKLIPTSNASNNVVSHDRKLFPKIPPLFSKNQDAKLTPTDGNEVVRGQNDEGDSGAGANDDSTLAASTRIRVKDGSKVHFGSGTIIESQPGRSVILTCGHIFRGLSKDAVIEVDYFTAGKTNPETVVGDVITYDLKSDLGLLEIPNSQPLPAVKLRTASENLVVENKVTSVGCGGGKLPSIQKHAVTSINRYRGPENIECTGIPQQGRSGGGLFIDSQLVGVCIAADPKDKRGIYTSMKPVEEILMKAKMGHLCSNAPTESAQVAERDTPPADAMPRELVFGDTPARGTKDPYASLIEEVSRGSADVALPSDYLGAEVVCIVRPKAPGAASRIVIVNQASARFVGDLLHESGSGQAESMTAASENPRAAAGGKRLTTDLVKNSSKQATKKPTSDKMPRSAASMEISSKLAAAQFEAMTGELPMDAVETSFEAQRYRRKRD